MLELLLGTTLFGIMAIVEAIGIIEIVRSMTH